MLTVMQDPQRQSNYKRVERDVRESEQPANVVRSRKLIDLMWLCRFRHCRDCVRHARVLTAQCYSTCIVETAPHVLHTRRLAQAIQRSSWKQHHWLGEQRVPRFIQLDDIMRLAVVLMMFRTQP